MFERSKPDTKGSCFGFVSKLYKRTSNSQVSLMLNVKC
jgi:hypothetical protein